MKAVLLDVSGVLRDNLSAIYKSYTRVLEPAGWRIIASPKDAYRLRALARYNLLENTLEALHALSEEGLPLDEALLSPGRIDRAVGKHPLTGKEDWAKKVKSDFRRTDSAYLQSIPPLQGSREGLVRLSARYRLAAVSNSGSDFNKVWLGHHGFSRFFSVFIGEQEVARKKPHPDGLLLAAEKLFVPVDTCFYVGDAQSDMLAAKNAGAVPVGVLTGTADRNLLEKAGAALVFDNLFEASIKL